jgi:uncharacterized protein (DUF305 family)
MRLTESYGPNPGSEQELREIREEKRLFLRSLESQRDLAFEFKLLLNLISHHAEAVRELRDCASESLGGDLKKFCQQAAEVRSTEGRTLEAWVCRWYRDCVSKAFPPYR